IVAGIVLALLFFFMGKSLELGPPGITFSILNSACVIPIFLSLSLFGASFGLKYNFWNGFGSFCVLMGLFIAAKTKIETKERKKWLVFVFSGFFVHVLYLFFLEWRSLLLHFPGKEGLGLAISSDALQTKWFMPMIFISAAIFHTIIFIKKEKRMPNGKEWLYGCLGGVANGVSASLVILGTEFAVSSADHAMMFPIFSVTIIVLCNLWGKWLYREQINWKANLFCISGIAIGTIDWMSLFKS
ncbi:MAG: hypothetical protein L0207_02145, partial [Chlamydiae bacterium]|nr:hypothetical protein [Chlamydiota bacterium]